MDDQPLPTYPPAGKTRYKATLRDPKENPFNPRGLSVYTQTVDVDKTTSAAQVEEWAREAAKGKGYEFVKLETLN